MIDWDKIGPANSPAPSTTPTTTAPVTPSPSGPDLSGFGASAIGQSASAQPQTSGTEGATQAQVDAMNPLERLGRGIDLVGSGKAWDMLGQTLFGRGNGSPLGGVPLLGDIVGGAGNVAHGVGSVAVKPFEIAGGVLSHIPTGGLGADQNFNAIGEFAKTNDPVLYQKWQAVNAAASGDILGGGNLRYDFVQEAAKYLDDKTHEGSLGHTPVLATGPAGSVGGLLSEAIQGFFGLGANTLQRGLGGAGFFDPSGHGGAQPFDAALNDFKTGQPVSDDAKYAFEQLQSGKFTEQQARDYYAANVGAGRDRVTEAAARIARGGDASDAEKQAVEAWQSGAWSQNHANDWLVSHGSSITRNPVGQLLGGALLDPLLPATIGAGSIAKAGKIGAEILSTGMDATTTYEKLATTIAHVQQSPLGPAFRIARGLIDPLAVYKPSTVERATTDLLSAVSLRAFERAYGPQTVLDLRALAREAKLTPEVDSAIASYSQDQALLMVANKVQRDLLQEGLGEEFVRSNVDDVIKPLAQQAARDAETELTDHMMTLAKNTFGPEEESTLAGRLSATFGNDTTFWAKRIENMSPDLKSALHAVTYKRAEVEFEQARAVINAAMYDGDLPLRQAVLISADTLDNVVAEHVIDNIRSVLKDEGTDAKIAAGTNEWNQQAARYPVMANIGYATGGRKQLEDLVKELEKQLQSGAITRRVLDDELKDARLAPWRDFLDRHSMPGDASAFKPATGLSSKPLIDEFGWPLKRVQELIDNSEMVPTDVIAGLREIDRRANPEPSVHASLEDLKSSIEANGGIDSPIIVWWDPKTKAAVVADGNHRLTLAIENGWSEVPVVVEARPTSEVAQAENIANIAHIEPKVGAPTEGVMKPSAFFPGSVSEAESTRRLWNIGFRPAEDVAWGLKRDPNTGKYIIDRAPTISHVIDAVPGRQPFSDTTRNVLGQIIGPKAAERANAPIESVEAFIKTASDNITGRRLVENISRRFERSTFEAGIPKPIAQDILAKARDVAGLDHTTVRGIKPDNLWDAIHEIIPHDLVLKDGSTLNIHIVMDHLLKAAEGDLRIMGLSSVFSQRMRNKLTKMGVPHNYAGQLTVTEYNRLRYAFNPMFVMQRVTDAPYYSILYGVTPVGKSLNSEALRATRVIEENIGRTGLARHFSMDQPEYATRANFTEGIKSAMQQAGLEGNKLQRVLDAPDAIIAANMTNMLYHRWGDIVKGALDNLATAAEKGDPALKADMLEAGDVLRRSFEDWRAIYSEQAGRVLNDNEVGLRYVQDQLNAWRRHVVNADGTLDFSQLIHEGERAVPASIGEVGTIRPDALAQQLGNGYADAAALRRDVTGHMERIKGVWTHVDGEHDLPWLEEQLRVKLGAHPDYTKRAMAYFGGTWDDFWHALSLPVEKGGLDISPHYAKEAQDLIAGIARERGMDPWEYLSGVMQVNMGSKDLSTAMGQFVSFLKGGPLNAEPGDWGAYIQSHLDPSAQRTLADEWARSVGKATKTGRAGKAATAEFFDTGIIDMLKSRVEKGVHPNADVESAIQQVSKLVQTTLKGTPAAGQTRHQLRELVNAIPIEQAKPFNRSEALVVTLLKDKIEQAQADVFRLAEMQTQRTVLERSLNHPLFGLYPASYMWGKVLPETVKFLARNPYAATYTIADVQRSIAIQREYDRNLDDKIGAIDRSSAAFLLDYLTPGLPWSDHQARMSPLIRGIFNGKDLGKLWDEELSTVSPQRWVAQVVNTLNEVPGAVDALNPPPAATLPQLDNLTNGASGGAPTAEPTQITGPTKASALAPILEDDLSRLQSILISGQSPEK